MNEKILVVDDVFDNIKVIINYLKDLNYELYFATNGEKAIQSIETVTPDLILMDVMMPVLNGLDTVTRIKKDERYKDIPVIFITALSEPEDISKGFQVGGVDYITKPIKSVELIARIQTHLQLEEHRKLLEKIVIEEKNEIDYLKLAQKQLVESEKMASLGGLVAGVAHEINTPLGICLTAITHFADSTKKLGTSYHDDSMTQSVFENYLQESNDISSILHSNISKTAQLVKSFKQIAVDQTSEDKRLFNLDEYLHEIIVSLQNLIKHNNINVTITCSEELKLYSYAGAFSQVVTNLIINSIKHAFKDDNKRIIDIIVTSNDENIEIEYKDNGAGIPIENQGKIFDPFFTTNRDGGGTGLGLNIVYNIMNSTFNGSIKCESILHQETTFTLVIPFKGNTLAEKVSNNKGN